MRTKIWIALVFLGAFLLVGGILGQTYAASKLKRTPIDVDNVTHLSGTATLNGPDGEETFPVKVTSTTKADSEKSSDSVVVFKNSSCVVRDEGDVPNCVSNDDPQSRLLTASTDDYATDRVTALAVNSPKYLPSAAVPHEGLVNKWPFDAKKKDYPYWNSTVEKAVTASYDGTVQVKGLKVYVYKQVIKDAPVEVASGVKGVYNDTIEVYVDPVTGAIVNQTSKQARTLEDGSPVLSLDIAFTDAQIKSSVDDAKSNDSLLALVTKVVPLVGYLVGIPVLLAGLIMLFLDARRGRPEDA